MNFTFLKTRFFIYFRAFSRLFGVVGCDWGDFLGSSGNSPFRAFSAKSEASSISAEKLNLLGLMDRGEAVLLEEKLGRVSSLSKLCLGESCLMDLVCFSVLRTDDFLIRVEGVSVLIPSGSSWSDSLIFCRFFVSICSSTDSDIISRISESANPAFF